MLKNRNIYLLAGTLVLLFVGLIYVWSIFIIPLEDMFGWHRGQTSHIFTISMICFCVSGILGGYLIKVRSSKLILRISAGLMFCGFILCSFNKSLIGIYFYYGILCSAGVGLTYNAVLSTVVKWFPDKPSFCSGVLLMGFGAGGFLLGNIARAVIHGSGIQTAFIIFAFISLIILFLASFFIFSPVESQQPAGKDSINSGENESTGKKLLKTNTFWCIFIWSMFASASGLAIIGQASPMAERIGLGGQLPALAVGICSVFNGLGRVVTGAVYSRFKGKTIMFSVVGMYLLAALILLYSLNNSSSIVVFLGFALAGFAFGSIPAFNVSIVRQYFGAANYSINMSIFNIQLIFASIIGSSLTGKIFQMTDSYIYLIITTLVTSLLASFSIFPFKERKSVQ